MYAGLFCYFFSFTFFWIYTEAYIAENLKKDVTCFKSDSFNWYLRSMKKCPKREELYHCLHDENDRHTFYEFCGDYITIAPGTYPVFRPDPPKILIRDCVGDTFQNQFLKSSILNYCFDKKKCDDKGQLVCENGSLTEDRRCKCDISIGMVIQIYGDSPSNKMTCCPDSDRSCDCFPKKCDPGFVLNEVYQCVKKCGTSGCVSTTRSRDKVTKEPTKPTTEFVSSTFVLTSTPPIVATENNPTSTEVMSNIFIGFGSVIVVILFTILVLYICCHGPFNKLTTGSCKDHSDDSQEGEHMLGTQENINDRRPSNDVNVEMEDISGPSGEGKTTIQVNVHGNLFYNNIDNCKNVATENGASFTNTYSTRDNDSDGGDSGGDDDDNNDDVDATDLKQVITEESETCDGSDFKGFR